MEKNSDENVYSKSTKGERKAWEKLLQLRPVIYRYIIGLGLGSGLGLRLERSSQKIDKIRGWTLAQRWNVAVRKFVERKVQVDGGRKVVEFNSGYLTNIETSGHLFAFFFFHTHLRMWDVENFLTYTTSFEILSFCSCNLVLCKSFDYTRRISYRLCDFQ